MKKFRTKVTAKLFQPIGNSESPGATAVTVLEKDSADKVLRATGTTVPGDGEAGYSKGCLFIDTDVGAGTTGVYENVGTTTACNFDTIGSGGVGVTTFTGLSDTPTNYTAAANKILKVNTGATAVEFVTVSGDVAMTAAGVMTVTDLTLTGEAQGDIVYFDGTNWVVLAAGTNGHILKTQGAAANPVWIDPTTLPTGIATGLSQSYTVEGGTHDIVHSVTTQTVGSPTLTIPDFANVNDTYAFVTLAQTLLNKTLTAPDINGGTADALTSLSVRSTGALFDLAFDTAEVLTGSKKVSWVVNDTDRTINLAGNVALAGGLATVGAFDIELTATAGTALTLPTTGTLATLAGAETLTNKTIASFLQGGANTITVPATTDTLVGKATTDIFTNKSFDCDGVGNVLSNVNANELDPITIGASTYGVEFTITYNLTNQAAAVNVFNANAPFKFRVIDAYSIATSGDGGTWNLNNGALGAGTDITSVVTVAASDKDIDRPAQIDDGAWEIAQNGSLSIDPDGAGLLDCIIFIKCLRVD
jgi:hypothetical protein